MKVSTAIAIVALLILGTMIVISPHATAAETSGQVCENEDYYTAYPQAACQYFCAPCVPRGKGGACTVTGTCC